MSKTEKVGHKYQLKRHVQQLRSRCCHFAVHVQNLTELQYQLNIIFCDQTPSWFIANLKYEKHPIHVYHSQPYCTSHGPINLVQTNICVTNLLFTAHNVLCQSPSITGALFNLPIKQHQVKTLMQCIRQCLMASVTIWHIQYSQAMQRIQPHWAIM